jgi:hypothetical protein
VCLGDFSGFPSQLNESNHSIGPPKGLNVRKRANRVFGSDRLPVPDETLAVAASTRNGPLSAVSGLHREARRAYASPTS